MSSHDKKNSEDYDVFISYDEYTGDSYAERLYKILTRNGYKVFVAHLERPKRSGDSEQYIDNVIENCTTFIFINTIEALTRLQVIREFQQSFPNGNLSTRDLWIFRHDMENVPYATEDFKKKTNIDLSVQNQSPFKLPAELAYSALTKCKKKRIEQSQVSELVKEDKKFDENQRKDYSELLQEKKFAQEFKKRGYEVDFQREIGNHLSADLIIRKGNNWIICEFKEHAKKVTNKIFGQLLKYKNELEYIDDSITVELWLIGKGLFSESIKNEAKKFKIKLIDDSNINEIFEMDLVYLAVPKSIIIFGESMKIRFRVDEIKNELVKLTIKNEKGKIILEKSFEIQSTTWIEHEITAKGDEWKEPGMMFSIIAEYGGKSALATIWRSNFGATIELDQKVYTWTDKVYITLVAPDFGNNETAYVDISTNEGKIMNYRLMQTGKNTGIFTGEIQLSGLKKHFFKHEDYLKDFLGSTKGKGPTDGFIPCGRNDAVQISFRLSEKERVVANALVRWNIGEIQWVDATYSTKGRGRIRVIDPDMNLNPNEIDKVEVKVWSDSDTIKKSLILFETNTNTGIFEGEINFDPKISNESTLQVSEGDTITAEYVDYTLPDPYTTADELDIVGTSIIGTVIPPLERLSLSNLQFFNENKNEVPQLISGKTVYVSATLKNNQDSDQKYAFFVQIKEKGNITLLLGTQHGVLKSGKTSETSIKWKPEFGGKFTLSVFVWEGIDNPSMLCPPFDKEITIEGKTAEELGFTKPLFEQRPIQKETIEISKKENLVIIPHGSSIPGCEETAECYIPSTLEIELNEEVIWENHDSAAHTITSGTPEGGPDGEFDSSLFMSGITFSHRFTKKGEYPYFDMTHPWQTGVIIVK